MESGMVLRRILHSMNSGARSRIALIVMSFLCSMRSSYCASPRPEIDFSRDIRPILSDKCFSCHGPDAEERQAGLRLDRQESATHELDSGATAIVPHDAKRSALVGRIFADNAGERMPPAESRKSLTDAEKMLLKRWVLAGGEYNQHWSYTRPERPAAPYIVDDSWSRSDID